MAHVQVRGNKSMESWHGLGTPRPGSPCIASTNSLAEQQLGDNLVEAGVSDATRRFLPSEHQRLTLSRPPYSHHAGHRG